MKKKETASEKRVIKDEADAEVAYVESLKAATQAAERLAAAEASETKRAAAEAAAAALRRVEESRLQAGKAATPELVRRTFWERLRNFTGA